MEMKKEEKLPKSLEIVTHKLPRNKEELYRYIETNMKGVIPPTPRWSVQPGHNSPLDFISESYFEEVTDCIVLANRHGVKTMSFSILAFLDLTHKNLGIATIGAIQPQARRSYEYTQKFCRLFPNYIDKSLMSTTSTKGGGNLEIVVGSISGVNSPHPCKAHIDEIELMAWNVLQEALSMTSSQRGFPSAIRMTSTRKRRFGPMARMLKESKSRGYKVYRWNIWDTIESCPKERSGKKPIDFTLQNGDIIQAWDKCPECPLIEVCQTKAKFSDGFYTIRDTIEKFRQLDREIWETQWECSKPGKQASIYLHLEEETHVRNQPYNPGLPTYVGQDFNFDPMVSIAFQVDGQKVLIIDELFLSGFSLDTLAKEYYQSWVKDYRIQKDCWLCDPSEPTMIKTLQSFGIPAKAAPRIGVWDGISLVSQKIKPSGKTDYDFYIDSKCRQFIDAMLNYRRRVGADGEPTDTIEKEDSHAPDGIRYGIVALFSTAISKPIPTRGRKVTGKYPAEIQRRLKAYKRVGMKLPRFMQGRR